PGLCTTPAGFVAIIFPAPVFAISEVHPAGNVALSSQPQCTVGKSPLPAVNRPGALASDRNKRVLPDHTAGSRQSDAMHRWPLHTSKPSSTSIQSRARPRDDCAVHLAR